MKRQVVAILFILGSYSPVLAQRSTVLGSPGAEPMWAPPLDQCQEVPEATKYCLNRGLVEFTKNEVGRVECVITADYKEAYLMAFTGKLCPAGCGRYGTRTLPDSDEDPGAIRGEDYPANFSCPKRITYSWKGRCDDYPAADAQAVRLTRENSRCSKKFRTVNPENSPKLVCPKEAQLVRAFEWVIDNFDYFDNLQFTSIERDKLIGSGDITLHLVCCQALAFANNPVLRDSYKQLNCGEGKVSSSYYRCDGFTEALLSMVKTESTWSSYAINPELKEKGLVDMASLKNAWLEAQKAFVACAEKSS